MAGIRWTTPRSALLRPLAALTAAAPLSARERGSHLRLCGVARVDSLSGEHLVASEEAALATSGSGLASSVSGTAPKPARRTQCPPSIHPTASYSRRDSGDRTGGKARTAAERSSDANNSL